MKKIDFECLKTLSNSITDLIELMNSVEFDIDSISNKIYYIISFIRKNQINHNNYDFNEFTYKDWNSLYVHSTLLLQLFTFKNCCDIKKVVDSIIETYKKTINGETFNKYNFLYKEFEKNIEIINSYIAVFDYYNINVYIDNLKKILLEIKKDKIIYVDAKHELFLLLMRDNQLKKKNEIYYKIIKHG